MISMNRKDGMDIDELKRECYVGLWDTAGSERYEAMSRIYYRSTWAAVLCYDLTDRASWDKVRFWASELGQHEPSARIYLAGTKKDLVEADPSARRVSAHEAMQLAGEISAAAVVETSAKNNEDISELFERIAKDYVKESRDKASTPDDPATVNLEQDTPSSGCWSRC